LGVIIAHRIVRRVLALRSEYGKPKREHASDAFDGKRAVGREALRADENPIALLRQAFRTA
jgi:hypothetical protein